MAEAVLRTFSDPKTYWNYALTENSPDIRGSLGLGREDRNLALRPVYRDGKLAPYTMSEKIYRSDGRIMRTSAGEYSIVTPKSGTGRFQVCDGDTSKILLEGRLNQGKVDSVDVFVRDEFNVNGRKVLLWPKKPEFTRLHAEQILKEAEEGSIKLHNLTKSLLKRMIASLPK